jgi:hypothetical protein
MIQGIVLCGLGVLTFGLGLKQFWDIEKKALSVIGSDKDEPSVEETPAPEKVESTDGEIAE